MSCDTSPACPHTVRHNLISFGDWHLILGRDHGAAASAAALTVGVPRASRSSGPCALSGRVIIVVSEIREHRAIIALTTNVSTSYIVALIY